ncbi:MAG: Fe-S cluster assembly protein SufD [Sphingobacteriales bacterium]|nr:MAG: Fe-S cluster assembly protein SufD [Sphingobacteriales bacterium]
MNQEKDRLDYLKEELAQKIEKHGSPLAAMQREALADLDNWGIPTSRHEEWKYTRIGSLFNKTFDIHSGHAAAVSPTGNRLPGSAEANELFFVNGRFDPEQSTVKSKGLRVLTFMQAAENGYGDFMQKHYNHSGSYLRDGLSALNTAFAADGILIDVADRALVDLPLYIYNVTAGSGEPVLSQPRILVRVGKAAELQIVETYISEGETESLTNQVVELVVEEAANVSYYKLQNDGSQASLVSTTHFRQIGKSVVNAVTISLNGAIVRNNLHAIMEAPHAEAHLWGLYFNKGNSHIDNHTLVDNVAPGCESNELYKGILDDQATGVFNGKIFVRKDAQKTNAFQSNKNIILSESASVNTKPQLEIFADDVKCSHGCTIGSPDEEALFYLQSRGIPTSVAMALLLEGFAQDIVGKIKLAPVREYIAGLIAERLRSSI